MVFSRGTAGRYIRRCFLRGFVLEIGHQHEYLLNHAISDREEDPDPTIPYIMKNTSPDEMSSNCSEDGEESENEEDDEGEDDEDEDEEDEEDEEDDEYFEEARDTSDSEPDFIGFP
ncbi:uncharacterized protein KY384_002216 [Bacidia gigantensis]|uniref:uncharacterized protein n=1 Tax=Bacidia gigantensis TaxID=2732470 RepID=UPI001D03B10B|nr:uncharacterized protein KY384_002216 [Bacidia gigantensis]KAG8533433.1 hypothetical protein KY384_002216 [Bacidia gigantensis]